MSKAILVDTTLCGGCGACVEACKQVNDLPRGEGTELSADTFNVVESHQGVRVRRFCMQCRDSTCSSVCSVEAFRKTATGQVVYEVGTGFLLFALAVRYLGVFGSEGGFPETDASNRFASTRSMIRDLVVSSSTKD